MRVFKDNKGREWHVQITFGSLQRCKAEGVDLTNLQTISAFGTDYFQLGVVIHSLLDNERQSRQITDDDFYSGFDGSVNQAAMDMILEDLADFTPPAMRPALTRVLEDRKTTLQMIQETVMSAEVHAAAEANLQRVKRNLLETFGKQAGRSPESSESSESTTSPSGSLSG